MTFQNKASLAFPALIALMLNLSGCSEPEPFSTSTTAPTSKSQNATFNQSFSRAPQDLRPIRTSCLSNSDELKLSLSEVPRLLVLGEQPTHLQLTAQTGNSSLIKNISWYHSKPYGSLTGVEQLAGKDVELSFTQVGLHHLRVILRDEKSLCTQFDQDILVTANPERQAQLTELLPPPGPFAHRAQVRAPLDDLTPKHNVIVAVIDTGIHYNHPSLFNHIWENKDEIPGNGIDDDSNGYIDDHIGYDFHFDDPFPFDDDGHGTHIAGLIAADGFGLAPEVKIMAIKAADTKSGNLRNVAQAIIYAVDQGAHVINLSLGAFFSLDSKLLKAMDYAEAHKVFIVVAAGNGHPKTGRGLNLDQTPMFPAALPYRNLVSVAAATEGLAGYQLTSYSNYSTNFVDLAAPGGQLGKLKSNRILSLAHDLNNKEGYRYLAGSSMAAPMVTAALALAIQQYGPPATPSDYISPLLQSVQAQPKLDGRVRSGGLLDIQSFLSTLQASTVLN